MANVVCPTCLGEKKQTITMTIWGSNERPITTVIDCISCNGTGEVSTEYARALKKHEEDWCSCKKSTGPRYLKNGEDKRCRKHHYRCTTCDKIVQIG